MRRHFLCYNKEARRYDGIRISRNSHYFHIILVDAIREVRRICWVQENRNAVLVPDNAMAERLLDDRITVMDGFLHSEIHLVLIARHEGLTRLGIRNRQYDFSRLHTSQDDAFAKYGKSHALTS